MIVVKVGGSLFGDVRTGPALKRWLADQSAPVLLIPGGGAFAVLSDARLKRWQNGTLTTYTRRHNLTPHNYRLHEDPQGILWLATRGNQLMHLARLHVPELETCLPLDHQKLLGLAVVVVATARATGVRGEV